MARMFPDTTSMLFSVVLFLSPFMYGFVNREGCFSTGRKR